MKEVIEGKKILFYDENGNEKMCIDYPCDECTWYFSSNEVLTITPDMHLYHALLKLMQNDYHFEENTKLKDYKDDTYLRWFSDCSYNPDDDWSCAEVSYLNISFEDEVFKVWCVKPLDKLVNRPRKFHLIAFSPLGNGKFSMNEKTGQTFQTEFVTDVYYELLNASKRGR